MLGRILRLSMRGMLRLVAVLVVVEIVLQGLTWSKGFGTEIESDHETGWRVRPNLRLAFRGENRLYTLETNSKGLRDKEYSYERTGDKFRIVTLGACETFGLGVSESECYVQLLEDQLYRTETVNLAGVGFSADQQFIALRREGLKYRPDMIVQFLSTHDGHAIFYPWIPMSGSKCFVTRENGLLELEPPQREAWPRIISSARTPLLIAMLFNLSSWHVPLLSHQPPDGAESFMALAQLVLETQSLCHQHGSDYVAVYTPGPDTVAAIAEYGDVSLPLAPLVLKYLCEEYSIPFLDMMPVMLDETQNPATPSPFEKKGDGVALYGHQVIAQHVSEYLAKRVPDRLAHATD